MVFHDFWWSNWSFFFGFEGMEQRLRTLSCGILRRVRILFLFFTTYDSSIATGNSVWTDFVAVIGDVGRGLLQYVRVDSLLWFSVSFCVNFPNLSRIPRICNLIFDHLDTNLVSPNNTLCEGIIYFCPTILYIFSTTSENHSNTFVLMMICYPKLTQLLTHLLLQPHNLSFLHHGAPCRGPHLLHDRGGRCGDN